MLLMPAFRGDALGYNMELNHRKKESLRGAFHISSRAWLVLEL
jgi:hypothetical protein